jgi:predicted anti-sigma-YlaC factor YlaD
MVHVHEDDIELYLGGRLEPARAPIAESHLLECESCRQLLSECLGQRLALHAIKTAKSAAAQKRSEPRFDTAGEGTIQELRPLSFDRQKIKIVNMSKNGLGILVTKAILPGTIVQLRIKDTVELGNVKYCSALEDGGFQIGLRLHGED